MKIDIFLKGILMGICDLVPGISGGTVAFITGIYERLINSVKGILSFGTLSNFVIVSLGALFFSKKSFKRFDEFYKKHDLYFLFTLLFGIIVAIFLGSYVISFLLREHFVITMSFFVGLIIASSFLIYGKIDDHNVLHRLLGLLGFLLGVALLFLVPASIDINYFYVFLSGVIGISAMFLPGISGSYILYIMGSYEHILGAVSHLDFIVLFVFGLGMIVGAIFISRFISFLLLKYHCATLYFLFGFVLGALFIPIRDIFILDAVLYDLIGGALMFFVGIVLVIFVSRLGKN
jgi:putative membrane protein